MDTLMVLDKLLMGDWSIAYIQQSVGLFPPTCHKFEYMGLVIYRLLYIYLPY